MSDGKWQRNANWIGSQIEDSFVMVNVETGKYVALNVSASAIWDALEQPCSAAEIASGLCQQFEIDAHSCRVSVDRTLGRMGELQIAVQL